MTQKDFKVEHVVECYLKANKFLKAYQMVRVSVMIVYSVRSMGLEKLCLGL